MNVNSRCGQVEHLAEQTLRPLETRKLWCITKLREEKAYLLKTGNALFDYGLCYCIYELWREYAGRANRHVKDMTGSMKPCGIWNSYPSMGELHKKNGRPMAVA